MVNKVAWITGAGSGIGEASAIKLASEGFSVVLSGRTKETLDMVASKCKGQVSVKALDVSNYAYVMDRGRVAMHGDSIKMKDDPKLLKLLAP